MPFHALARTSIEIYREMSRRGHNRLYSALILSALPLAFLGSLFYALTYDLRHDSYEMPVKYEYTYVDTNCNGKYNRIINKSIHKDGSIYEFAP